MKKDITKAKRKGLNRRIFTSPISPFYFVTTAKKMVQGNLYLTKATFAPVVSFFSSLGGKPARTPVGRIKDSQARYRYALEYYGYQTDEQVIKQQRAQLTMTLLFFFALVIQVPYGIWLFNNGASGLNNMLLDVVHCFFLTPLIVANLAKYAFQYSQIRHKRLFSFGHWLIRPHITWSKPHEITLTDVEYEYWLERALIIPRRNFLALPSYA